MAKKAFHWLTNLLILSNDLEIIHVAFVENTSLVSINLSQPNALLTISSAVYFNIYIREAKGRFHCKFTVNVLYQTALGIQFLV